MLAQGFSERVHILGRFQAIEIVRLLAKIQPGCPELFPSLPVSHPSAAPVVALQQDQRAANTQSSRRRQLRQPERIAQSRNHFTAPCAATSFARPRTVIRCEIVVLSRK